MLAKAADGGASVGVVAIADDVPAIGGSNGVKHLGMYARVVVAREAAAEAHDGIL